MISVIIPTRNRASSLKTTLYSLSQQQHLEKVEIIVVDNGSTDGTAQLCQDLIEKGDMRLRYYHDAEPGLLTGRHLGASVALGDLLCFLDDDVYLNPTWTGGVIDAFSDVAVQLATGPCLPLYETYPPAWLMAFWGKVPNGKACGWLSLIDLGSQKLIIDTNYVWGLNFFIRKAALLELGGFHPDNIPPHLQAYQGNGETGLTLKAKEKGFKALYHPSLLLHHIVPAERLTLAYFEKRAFYQGICHSFYELRKETYGTANEKPMPLSEKVYWALKKRSLMVKERFTSVEIRNLLKRFNQKEQEGYAFHQQAYLENEKVRSWV